MLIKFNNGSGEHAYEPIYIDSDWIVSVYEENHGDYKKTIIYGGPRGTTWTVQETIDEACKMINKVKNGGNVA